MDERRIRVLLVDDQILFVESLKCVFEDRAPDMEVVGVAHDGEEALAAAIKLQPDVVLMDVRMPGTDGVRATMNIHELYPKMKVVMLTTFDDDEYVHVALKFGAAGYLLKNMPPDELIRTVRSIRHSVAPISQEVVGKILSRDGDMYAIPAQTVLMEKLTTREKEVLALILDARDNQSIADHLCVSEQTIKNHIHNIYSKLGISNRIQLIKLLGNAK